LAVLSPDAHATFLLYTNKEAWQSAVGAHTTITFQGFPEWTNITNQFSHLGVTFTDGSDVIHFNNSFPNDGVGLYGNTDFTTVEFSQPIYAIAVDYPGGMGFQVFSNGLLLLQFYDAPGGAGLFAGLVSTEPFDKVRLFDNFLFFDDLHFGPPIPAPATIGIMGLAASVMCQRRRQERPLAESLVRGKPAGNSEQPRTKCSVLRAP
jgi:hypothetical protein